MSEKTSTTFKIPYTDDDLPKNTMDPKFAKEMEDKIMPGMIEEFNKLRKEKPELFPKPTDK